jgi:Abortive infection C-terminus
MPAVKNVGEPCAGEPHARIDGGREETGTSRPQPRGARRLSPTRPTSSAASDSLSGLFKRARAAAGADAAEADLGHRLAAVVDQLAQVRNVAGAGHGRADQREVSAREARLAATAACGVALFLLGE